MSSQRFFTPLLFSLLIFYCAAFSMDASAQVVDRATAEAIASTFIATKSTNTRLIPQQEKHLKSADSAKTSEVHVVNFSPSGFVVVAGNEQFPPILAWSDESNIDLSSDDNPGVDYVRGTSSFIKEELLTRKKGSSQKVASAWANLKSSASFKTPPPTAVGPLTTTTWGQDLYYNAACPVDQFGPDDRTYAGCVTVAMAQLMKYHNHPPRGNGTNNYFDANYGQQTVDFGATIYDWNSMPDALSNYNGHISQLILHTAQSVNTAFSTFYTAAYFSLTRNALVYHWMYDRSAISLSRSVDPNGWYGIIQKEIDEARPCLMRATAVSGGAHAWLIDGYDTDGFYHMNWGWGGNGNGWFLDNGMSWALEDGGTNGYYNDISMVYNIFPAAESCPTYQAAVDMYVHDKTETSATTSLFAYAGAINNQARLREAGSNTWIESDISTDLQKEFDNLLAGVDYEFQYRVQCSQTSWSNYSDSFPFTTAGVACRELTADKLTVSSVSDNFAYIYTLMPFGNDGDAQFRYRKSGNSNWITFDVESTHVQALYDLLPGTEYEFSVRHVCSSKAWTDFSEIQTFTTSGTAPFVEEQCSPPVSFVASSITETYAYLIIGDPSGASNQFRYRLVGSSSWIETSVSTEYYRFINGLTAGSLYEYQLREACGSEAWSSYTDSATFNTLGEDPITAANCAAPVGLLSSSTTDHYTYIYLGHNTIGDNQFRYRPVGNTQWLTTEIDGIYYRFIDQLLAGTTYEFQSRQECANGEWSDYSAKANFQTTGTPSGGSGGTEQTANCSVDQSQLSHDAFYIYYFKTGHLQLEFRWKVGGGAWAEPKSTTAHYLAIRNDLNVNDSSGFAFQVRLQCTDGNWTDYSDTYFIP